MIKCSCGSPLSQDSRTIFDEETGEVTDVEYFAVCFDCGADYS